MKKVWVALCVAMSVSMMASAQMEQIPPAVKGQVYGAKVKEKGAMDISLLPSALQTDEDKKIETKLRAKVIDVCPKKGCWMNLYINDSTTAFVKMKDYGFFVPLDIAGKEIVIDGTAYIEETSVAELRHYAEDAKKSKEEIEAITEPQQNIRITAKGIKVIE
jgi:hypothetical protein